MRDRYAKVKRRSKRLAANRRAAPKFADPRTTAGQPCSSLNALHQGRRSETMSANALELADTDSKGLLGFGLALAAIDSKWLFGFGKPAADSHKPFILFELRGISAGEKVKIYEKSWNENK